MIMADVFKILFLIVGTLLCTVCYWLIFQALFSDKVGRCRKAIVEHPYRVFMTGGIVGLPLFLFAFTLMANGAGPLVFIGGAVMVALTVFSLLGSTGIALQIGERLSAGDVGPGRALLRGGAVLSIACVLPIVGWFFLIPLVLITGFGASVRLIWARQRVTATPPPVDAVQA
jgi:hypothetical protein